MSARPGICLLAGLLLFAAAPRQSVAFWPFDPKPIVDIYDDNLSDDKLLEWAQSASTDAETAVSGGDLCLCGVDPALKKGLEAALTHQRNQISDLRRRIVELENVPDEINKSLGDFYIDLGGDALALFCSRAIGPIVRDVWHASAGMLDLVLKGDMSKSAFVGYVVGQIVDKVKSELDSAAIRQIVGDKLKDWTIFFGKILVKLPALLTENITTLCLRAFAKKDSRKALIQATLDLREAWRKLRHTAAGGCRCASGCSCPHCMKNHDGIGGKGDGDPGNGGPPGDDSGVSSGGGTDENYISKWIREARLGDEEDPWKPIHDGIVREGSVASGSGGLLDVFGFGEFSKVLDKADELASIAATLGIWGEVAKNIWSAIASGGSGLADLLKIIGDSVVDALDLFFDELGSRIGEAIADWIGERLKSVTERLEELLDPINAKIDEISQKIREWLAEDVSKWIETMREYSKNAKSAAEKDLSLRRWSVVDFGVEGVETDGTGATLRGRVKGTLYEEVISR